MTAKETFLSKVVELKPLILEELTLNSLSIRELINKFETPVQTEVCEAYWQLLESKTIILQDNKLEVVK